MIRAGKSGAGVYQFRLPGVAGDSDDETDEIDDENNFSVYECPGLAPTGDIEVYGVWVKVRLL